MKKMKKRIIVILLLIIVLAGVFVVLYKDKLFPANSNNLEEPVEFVAPEPEPEVQIFKGDARPVAVMIDNHKDAWHHVGLNNAYLVYEFMVEGGVTRLMPVFKGNVPDEVGPIRSARPYYIDYALENDAIFIHFGYTIQAGDDMRALKINEIEGMLYDGSKFWRDKKFSAPHNAMTGNENLNALFTKNNFRTTSTDKGFNFTAKEYDLESTLPANSITLKYSTYQTTSYEYNTETKMYQRSMGGKPHTDARTKEQYAAKNIIVLSAKYENLNDKREVPDKGYQKLFNIGEGTGYFITNGEHINITWKKASREAKTQYFGPDGNEIKLNDGITYVQIVPTTGTITIE